MGHGQDQERVLGHVELGANRLAVAVPLLGRGRLRIDAVEHLADPLFTEAEEELRVSEGC